MIATAAAAPPRADATLSSPAAFTVVSDSADKVTLQWNAVADSGLVGYRVLVSGTPGAHPLQTSWNGYPAAFSWTTDDSRPDNVVWGQVAAQFGYKITIFTISGLLGQPGFLTVPQLNALHAQGHEIAAHSITHPYLTTDKALLLKYVGPAPGCTVSINNSTLTTYLGIVPDVVVNLTDPSVYYLDQLAAHIDSLPNYECTLMSYTIHIESTESRWLDPIYLPGTSIKPGPVVLTTRKGCDDAELAAEVTGSKAALESLITDSSYVCTTFSYPFHMHEQREIDAVMAAGYVGARDGYYGPRPGASPVDIDSPNRVDLYEKPETFITWSNANSEAGTRNLVRDYIATIKSTGDWGHVRTVHFLSDTDSLHLVWLLDELRNDGGVWVASFGEVAAYARQFGITVANPLVAGSNPATCLVTLGAFDPPAAHYAVVVAYDSAGVPSAWSNEVVWGGGTDVADSPANLGASGRLAIASYPNPVSGAAHFAFSLPGSAIVRLAVYEPSGRLVRRVLDERLEPGRHVADWDGEDDRGARVAPGVYFYEIKTPAGLPTTGKFEILR